MFEINWFNVAKAFLLCRIFIWTWAHKIPLKHIAIGPNINK